MESDQRLPLDDREVLTVSQVNRMARELLENVTVWVGGEVSDVNAGYRYYTYFTLRDEGAALPAILPKSIFESLDFSLADGDQVLAFGKLSLYEKRGGYQLRVSHIEPFGEGELRRRIERLKRKLAAEGLFADERKRALPQFPDVIGVISSVEGAAVRDVVRTISRRFPPARILIKDVRVQGSRAVGEICDAIALFDTDPRVDVVIMARGGGSLQDLEPFNSEEVARAIASSTVPLITGVGHEPDVTVADLVADLRASTPTGAAEAAVPEGKEILSRLESMGTLMGGKILRLMEANARHLEYLINRPLYRQSEFLLADRMQRMDLAIENLQRVPVRSFERMRERFDRALASSAFTRSELLLSNREEKVARESERMVSSMVSCLREEQTRLEGLQGKIEALSPLAVLERGYAIAFPAGGRRALRTPSDVEVGDEIEVRLHRGHLYCEVEDRRELSEKE